MAPITCANLFHIVVQVAMENMVEKKKVRYNESWNTKVPFDVVVAVASVGASEVDSRMGVVTGVGVAMLFSPPTNRVDANG